MQSAVVRDLGWAVLIGVLFGASPHTGTARVGASVAGGGLMTAAVLGYRLWRRRRDPQRVIGPATAIRVEGSAVALAAVGLAWLVAFGPTLVWLAAAYADNIWRNAHGFFVPVLMFLLMRSALARVPDDVPAGSSAAGFAWLAGGLALLVWDAGAQTRLLGALGLVLSLPGLALLLLGPVRTRAIAVPLALGLLLLPLPEGLEDPLYLTSAMGRGMELLLGVVQVPAARAGSLFVLPGGPVGVTEGCSGLATLHAAFALALPLAIYNRFAWRRVAVFAAPLVALLVFNAMRGTALLFFVHHQGFWVLDTPAHGLSGIFTLWLVLGSVLLFADWPRLREALR